MRSLLTILLMLIIFLQTFSRFVVEADYFINKSYIARVLCINKEKPKMHCNGKCYLAKQLKEEQKQQQAPVAKKSTLDVPYYNIEQAVQLEVYSLENERRYLPARTEQLSSFAHSIFHPPTV
ncbi:MAG TPA: hypothetical protein VLJ41_14340 [Segetibacter sp.]|nr:hypothetical protein [Segetibacter sp.]